MKIAYLIQTHRNPKLLRRKIESLSSENCAFFIHVDRKSNINDFSSIKGPNVFFTEKRIPVYWGEYSLVEAILILIEQALDGPETYDYFVLSTGSDYPLKNKEYIHDFFDRNRGKEFISSIKMTNNSGYLMVQQVNTFRIPSSRPITRIATRIAGQFGLISSDYRRHLGSFDPYFGNCSWSLTRDACQYILDFVGNNQSFCNYFRNTFAPDEMLFPTILSNSPFKARISRHLIYEDWSNHTTLLQGRGIRHWFSRRLSGKLGHPVLIGREHINFFEETGKVIIDDLFGSEEMLFARKFCDDNLVLVQQLENVMKQKESRVNDRDAPQSSAGTSTFVQEKQRDRKLGHTSRETQLTVPPGLWHLSRNCSE